MIGNERQLFGGFDGAKHPMTFNLSKPLDFRDSKSSHGIQLADALAGAAIHVWSGGSDDHAKSWREVLVSIAHLPILPGPAEVDLRLPATRRNAILLDVLHDRASNGRDLIEGMAELIFTLSQRLRLPMRNYIVE